MQNTLTYNKEEADIRKVTYVTRRMTQ
jgi:hypothetical protein